MYKKYDDKPTAAMIDCLKDLAVFLQVDVNVDKDYVDAKDCINELEKYQENKN